MKLQPLASLHDSKHWQAIASGEASLSIQSIKQTLRLEYDFKDAGGFVVARRVVRRQLPSDFIIRFRLRGRGECNHLELKLVDPSNTNVWRWQKRDHRFNGRWQTFVISSNEIEFAWGPAGGGAPSAVGAIELAIVAKDGGKGSIDLSDLTFEDQSFTRRPKITRTDKAMTLDAGAPRSLGGLIIEWRASAPKDGFTVSSSNDGKRWKRLHKAPTAGGKRSYLYLPGIKARHLRVECSDARSIRRISVQPFEFSRSLHSFWHHIASVEPRGWHPRWLHREQSLWTPVSNGSSRESALINEQGLIEPHEGSFTLEPFVLVNGKLYTWNDVECTSALEDRWKPHPIIRWQTPEWTLSIRLLSLTDGTIRAQYDLANHTRRTINAHLLVAIRPFQVTPPWQSFRNVGGVSRIHRLGIIGDVVWINDSHELHANPSPDFGAMSFDEGNLVSLLADGTLPGSTTVIDALGFATGALRFDLQISSGASEGCSIATRQSSAPVVDWDSILHRAVWHSSIAAKETLDAMHTAAAHILITRDGPALQPGPRRYTRSWIRDGTIMCSALLRMGRVNEVREFIEWYAPHQRADGFVPCCVDRDGVDPLIEHDSHGQFIALIADYTRFTGDTSLAAKLWSRVQRTVHFIEHALEANGLMPISASHEGYLAQPVHSFWDNFWTLRGLKDAEWLSSLLKKNANFTALTHRFAQSLFTAIKTTREIKQLDYIPGSIEWADFDPTATANAITLLDLPEPLDRAIVERTFSKYLADWRRKRSGDLPWSNYTPYEIRIIGALVRLGWRDESHELLRFFMADRRPLAWNQWPEIAWRDPLAPAHIGDVPHTWIAAEFVLAVRSMFVFEDHTAQQLVIGAGVSTTWLTGEGIQLRGVPTSYGQLHCSMRAHGRIAWRVEMDDTLRLPSHGIVVRLPEAEQITIHSLPAKLTLPRLPKTRSRRAQ